MKLPHSRHHHPLQNLNFAKLEHFLFSKQRNAFLSKMGKQLHDIQTKNHQGDTHEATFQIALVCILFKQKNYKKEAEKETL